MTCIVGLKTSEAIYIGGDGRVSIGYHRILRDGSVKVFERDGIVYGGMGSLRGCQVIQHALATPRYHPDDDPLEFASIKLTRAMRNALQENNAMSQDRDGREHMGVGFAVAFQDRLLEIDAWGCVLEPVTGELALGCGEEFALGSLEATRSSDLTPEQRILHAIVAAERHSSGVGDSITLAVVPIGDDGDEIVMTTVDADPPRGEDEDEQPKPKGKKKE